MPSVFVKHVLLMLCGNYCWSCCCGSMFCSGCCSWMSPPSCAVLYEPQLVHFIPSTWKGTVQWAWQSLHIICSKEGHFFKKKIIKQNKYRFHIHIYINAPALYCVIEGLLWPLLLGTQWASVTERSLYLSPPSGSACHKHCACTVGSDKLWNKHRGGKKAIIWKATSNQIHTHCL